MAGHCCEPESTRPSVRNASRFPRLIAASGATVLLAACSPYVYKEEVNRFAAGVEDLASAYQSGLSAGRADERERRRRNWVSSRARLAVTEDCFPQLLPTASAESPCSLREVGRPTPTGSPTLRVAAQAAPIAISLQRYGKGLAAVTNAADQDALAASQTQLKDAIQGLLKAQNSSGATVAGPVGDAVAQIATIALNARRYRVLKEAVAEANQPIADLGYAMGEALGSLQLARQNELLQTAQALSIGLGRSLSSAEYAERVKILDEKVAAIETLRQSNPRQAAQEMVAAHEQLNKALSDNSRQREAVAQAVSTFVEKAEAVRKTFTAGNG